MNQIPVNSMKSIVIRMNNALNNFYDTVQEIAGINRKEAAHVFAIYKQEKIIKLDVHDSRYKVSHGIFMDKRTILHALSESIN